MSLSQTSRHWEWSLKVSQRSLFLSLDFQVLVVSCLLKGLRRFKNLLSTFTLVVSCLSLPLLGVWGVLQLHSQCLLILMFVAPLQEVHLCYTRFLSIIDTWPFAPCMTCLLFTWALSLVDVNPISQQTCHSDGLWVSVMMHTGRHRVSVKVVVDKSFTITQTLLILVRFTRVCTFFFFTMTFNMLLSPRCHCLLFSLTRLRFLSINFCVGLPPLFFVLYYWGVRDIKVYYKTTTNGGKRWLW